MVVNESGNELFHWSLLAPAFYLLACKVADLLTAASFDVIMSFVSMRNFASLLYHGAAYIYGLQILVRAVSLAVTNDA